MIWMLGSLKVRGNRCVRLGYRCLDAVPDTGWWAAVATGRAIDQWDLGNRRNLLYQHDLVMSVSLGAALSVLASLWRTDYYTRKDSAGKSVWLWEQSCCWGAFQQGKADFSDYLSGKRNQQAGCTQTATFDSKLQGTEGFRLLWGVTVSNIVNKLRSFCHIAADYWDQTSHCCSRCLRCLPQVIVTLVLLCSADATDCYP